MRNYKFGVLLFLVLSVFLGSSCTSQKKLTMLREVTPAAADTLNQQFKSYTEPLLAINDELLIVVSALDKDAVAPFNLSAVATIQGTNTLATSTATLQTYIVDQNGNITMPIIGDVHVAGLTKSEAKQAIEERIKPLLKDAQVTVRLIGYTYTVLGEVKNPGMFQASTDRITLLEALGKAGDLTPYGQRNNVLVTREVDGQLQFARIDLNSEEVFSSPYYYLQQNDVIYVSPNKVRAVSSQNLSLYLSMASTMASLATVIVSIVNLSKK